MIVNKNAINEIHKRLKAKAELIGEIVKSDAIRLTPVDTGKLKSSNKFICVFSRDMFKIYNFNDAEHAPYVELGTGIHTNQPGANKDGWVYPIGDADKPEFRFTTGQKPQPFLLPALMVNKQRIKRILKK